MKKPQAPSLGKKMVAVNAPTENDFRNPQLDLFQNFLCNSEAEREQLSNTIDLWDSVPRYSVSRQAMIKMRTADGFLGLLEIKFSYKGASLKAVIQPARIREEGGATLDYYPSANEELVEDALRKIAAEEQQGFFDKANCRSGVVFSLYMLREELKKRGHARSYQEIIKSLQILSGSLIEIRADEGVDMEAFTRTNYLPSLAAVSRRKLKDNPDAKWVAQFHPLVTQSVDALTYRQFNYHRMMAHNTQLARWLHKQLSLKFTFASIANTFDILYSTVKRDSALINYKRERDGIDALDKAFDELREQSVLTRVEKKETLGARGKIEDVKYTLYPTMEFIREVKAANRRLATTVDKLLISCG
jgi:hypothetical protein